MMMPSIWWKGPDAPVAALWHEEPGSNVGPLGKKASILKKVKGQRLLTDPILIHEMWRLWK